MQDQCIPFPVQNVRGVTGNGHCLNWTKEERTFILEWRSLIEICNRRGVSGHLKLIRYGTCTRIKVKRNGNLMKIDCLECLN